MFVGHYAASLAAKAIEPRVPLWIYAGAAQLVDIIWSGLVLSGIERFEFDPALLGNTMVLSHMPFSHSLPATLGWSILFGLACLYGFKVPLRGAVLAGLVVLSHWLQDVLVHRPDMPLGFLGPKLGLGLWNQPLPEMLLEVGTLGLAAIFWSHQRARTGLSVWPVAAFVAILLVVQWIGLIVPAAEVKPHAMTALATFLAVTCLAFLLDRPSGAARTGGLTRAAES